MYQMAHECQNTGLRLTVYLVYLNFIAIVTLNTIVSHEEWPYQRLLTG